MNDNETKLKICRSIILYDFLSKYNSLENYIRKLFEGSIIDIDVNTKNYLYFYYGTKIDIYMDFQNNKIMSVPFEFNDNERFKKITFNQIIKIQKQRTIIEKLNCDIQSVQSKTYYSICDVCIKLISMRNKLAHEICDCNFKNADIVEKLSDENICKYIEKYNYDFNVSQMSDDIKEIFSNVVYIDAIIEKLQ